MNADDYKKLLEEALDPIKQQLGDIEGRLDNPDAGLKRLNNRVDANTAAVMELEKTVKGYGDSYKINKQNIEVPEDLKVPHFADQP